MYNDKILSFCNLECFNFTETKKNVKNYFKYLEKLMWEWEKLNAQKGVTANYDPSAQYKKEPYSPIGKDIFGLSVKEYKEEEIRKIIVNHHRAKNSLSHNEQVYINEYFHNRKYEDEIAFLLGIPARDSYEFKNLKKSAIYKFADFLNLLVES